jgi:hypothetical protein
LRRAILEHLRSSAWRRYQWLLGPVAGLLSVGDQSSNCL